VKWFTSTDPAPAADPVVAGFDEEISGVRSSQRVAVGVDLLAISMSLAANVAEAPKTWAGLLVAVVCPLLLAVMVLVWHKAHKILTGWQGHTFTALLAIIAFGCGAVSFSHITHVAMSQGQTKWAAIIIALAIDVTALAMAVLVIASNTKQDELVKARQAHIDQTNKQAKAKNNAAADEGLTKLTAKPKKGKVKASEITVEIVAAARRKHPEATHDELAEMLNTSKRTVGRRLKEAGTADEADLTGVAA